ncbi:aromatic ring-hydroxylating dioxygenase subunit alpha [Thalassotalea aquiviva]|uniref:aromatic ring-hydroxylating oxygenase subunit alpha n=1 Tax=Thalassotalea aquiviva TaxID=3242415 RepID=UPI00352ADC3B
MDIKEQLNQYQADLPITLASTPPSSWYTDSRFYQLEQNSVFKYNWLIAGRVDQLKNIGDYLATTIANQPVLLVNDGEIRAFYNVCQHHAAQIKENGVGCSKTLTCPYHGWTYQLNGQLKSAPLFGSAENFSIENIHLKPIKVAIYKHWVFICFSPIAADFLPFIGALADQIEQLHIDQVEFYHRSSYQLDCNWKVYIDNYLDGGYHVPFLHKGLNSALDGKHYQVETQDRYCLQSCPTKARDNEFSKVRTGMARYYWQYPNLMLNAYQGILGLMIVQPLGPSKCEVIFEYYFDQSIDQEYKQHSVRIADTIQDEDRNVCESVQRGLMSDGYDVGRLSPAKELGEQLFHQLLHADFKAYVDKR